MSLNIYYWNDKNYGVFESGPKLNSLYFLEDCYKSLVEKL